MFLVRASRSKTSHLAWPTSVRWGGGARHRAFASSPSLSSDESSCIAVAVLEQPSTRVVVVRTRVARSGLAAASGAVLGTGSRVEVVSGDGNEEGHRRLGTVALERTPIAFVLLDAPLRPGALAPGAALALHSRGAARVRPPPASLLSSERDGGRGVVIDYLGRELTSADDDDGCVDAESARTDNGFEGDDDDDDDDGSAHPVLFPTEGWDASIGYGGVDGLESSSRPPLRELAAIDTPLHTGTAALDALAPLGRGQVRPSREPLLFLFLALPCASTASGRC